MKIKKDDNVIVKSGKDRGKKGKVIAVYPTANKVTVEGLNLLVKHVKPKRQGEKGQRVQFSRPVPADKVGLVCPKCNKVTRVGYKILEDGKKKRVCKKCQATLN